MAMCVRVVRWKCPPSRGQLSAVLARADSAKRPVGMLLAVQLAVACSLCVAMGMRAPVPRMALDNGGAAIAIRGLDIWAGSNNLIEPFDWRIMPRERWSLLGVGARRTHR